MVEAVALTPKQRLKEGYQVIREALESRQENATMKRYLTFTREISAFGENSTNVTEGDMEADLFADAENKPLDDVMRDQVYMRLRCQGDLAAVRYHAFFGVKGVSQEVKNKFYYCMSAKALFYFILKCSPQVEKVMMSKYLENPLNPLMFIEYDHEQDDYAEGIVGSTRRIMHLDKAFMKYTRNVDCNLICIGAPGIMKSTLLNDVFGIKHEVMDTGEHKCRMFHDSVDVTFASTDIKHETKRNQQFQFNIFDFQGTKANHDYKLILEMLERMPHSILVVQEAIPEDEDDDDEEQMYLRNLPMRLFGDQSQSGDEDEQNQECRKKLLEFVKQGRLLLIFKGFDDDDSLEDTVMNVFDIDDEDDLYQELVQQGPEEGKFPAMIKVGVSEMDMYEEKIQCTADQKKKVYSSVIDLVGNYKHSCKYTVRFQQRQSDLQIVSNVGHAQNDKLMKQKAKKDIFEGTRVLDEKNKLKNLQQTLLTDQAKLNDLLKVIEETKLSDADLQDKQNEKDDLSASIKHQEKEAIEQECFVKVLESRKQNKVHEYNYIQGDYWLLEDSFSQASRDGFTLEVKKLSSQFRTWHMDIKRDLFEQRANRELTVETFFPRYTKKHVDSKIIFLSDQIKLENKKLIEMGKKKDALLDHFWQNKKEQQEEEQKERQGKEERKRRQPAQPQQERAAAQEDGQQEQAAAQDDGQQEQFAQDDENHQESEEEKKEEDDQQNIPRFQRLEIFRKQSKEEYKKYENIERDEKKKKERIEALEISLEQNRQRKRRFKKGVHGQDDPLYTKFFEAVIAQKTDLWQELCRLVECKYSVYVNELNRQRDIQRKVKDENEKRMYKTKDKQRESHQKDFIKAKEQIDELDRQINKSVIDQEQFFRESHLKVQRDKKEGKTLVVQSDHEGKEIKRDPEEQQIKFYESLSEMFEAGQSLEIIDGDLRNVDQESLSKVMDFVQRKKQLNKNLIVVTVLGPQSSGKSTLLNYLFGSKFNVSAGRCTRGLNAMLLRTEIEGTKEILVLDSEGLFSIDVVRDDPDYDRNIVIFCMAVSNILLVNMKGELSVEVQDTILKEAVEGALLIKQYLGDGENNKKVRPLFVCRDLEPNQGAIVAQYTAIKNNLQERAASLKSEQEQNSEETKLSEIIDLQGPNDSVFLFSQAVKQDIINNNSGQKINKSQQIFREKLDRFRYKLFKYTKEIQSVRKVDDLTRWIKDSAAVWASLTENDGLKQAKDIRGEIELRETIDAVMKFGRIMSQAALFDEDPNAEIDNPLLKNVTHLEQSYLENYRKIKQNDRFFKYISDNLIKGTIQIFKEDIDRYHPLEDEQIQGVRRDIRTEMIHDRADVRQLTQQMADAYKLTQTAAKAVNKDANQQIYINYIIKRIQDKAQRIFDLEILFLELDVSFQPKQKVLLERIIAGEELNEQSIKQTLSEETERIKQKVDEIYKKHEGQDQPWHYEDIKFLLDQIDYRVKRIVNGLLEYQRIKNAEVIDPVLSFLQLTLYIADDMQKKHHEQVIRDQCYDIDGLEAASKDSNQGRALKRFNEAQDFSTLQGHIVDPVVFEEETYRDFCEEMQRNLAIKQLPDYLGTQQILLEKLKAYQQYLKTQDQQQLHSTVSPELLKTLHYDLFRNDIVRNEVHVNENDYVWKQDNGMRMTTQRVELYGEQQHVKSLKLLEKISEFAVPQDMTVQSFIESLIEYVSPEPRKEDAYPQIPQDDEEEKKEDDSEKQEREAQEQKLKKVRTYMLKRKRQLRDELIKMACETEVHHTWKYAKGCDHVCPCCGARCQNFIPCNEESKDDELPSLEESHQSKYHRPWAFAYRKQQSDDDVYQQFRFHKKRTPENDLPELRKEHCLSKNVRDQRKKDKSAFRDPKFNATIIQELQERAYVDDQCNKIQEDGQRKRKQNELAQGVNILLEWEHNDTLDLMYTHTCLDPEKQGKFTQGCQKCKKSTSETARQSSKDLVKNGKSYTHVCIQKPRFLINKPLEMQIRTRTLQKTDKEYEIGYKLSIYNQQGVEIFSTVDAKISVPANQTEDLITKIEYVLKLDEETIKKGPVAIQDWLKDKKRNWVIKPMDVAQAKGDQYTAEYRELWNSKWKSINDILCSEQYFNIDRSDSIVTKLN